MSEPMHIISLGAGVQSSTVALMAAMGEIAPMPVAGVFADTKHEPKEVYIWLDWLEKKLPFPIYRVSRGSLVDMSLRVREKKDGSGKWVKSLIPAYMLNKDGSKGIMGRQCTWMFKLDQLEKKVREIAKIPRGCKEVRVVQWIGISLDEIYRMKPARVPWAINRWPLIEAGLKRYDCLQWWDRLEKYDDRPFHFPPRSACKFCPFHSDAEWARMKKHSPGDFAEVVKYEKDLQLVKSLTDNMKGIPFLHSSLKPLSEVDFSSEEERGQLNMFNNECEGMCGV